MVSRHGAYTSPRTRGEGLVGGLAGEASPKGDGEGASPGEAHPETPPHLRCARLAPGKRGSALSPHRGERSPPWHPLSLGRPAFRKGRP